jgi:hypothetical protein
MRPTASTGHLLLAARAPAGIPARLNVTTCRPLLTSFCKAVDTQWSCIYPYKRAGFRCSQRDGACDLDDICACGVWRVRAWG